MKGIGFVTTSLLASASVSIAHGEPNLKHEHAGEVFSKVHGYHHGLKGVFHHGNSTGVTRNISGESVYIASPCQDDTDAAILYLTDIFGNALVNNRLLADSFSKAGYQVFMPDLFRGDPVPADALSDPNSTFNMTEWRTRHPESQIDEIITTTLTAIRGEYNIPKVAGTGYCFGGKYIAKFLAKGKGLDAGFTAHPSNTLATEWEAVASPIAIGFGDLDNSNTPENRTNIESIFQASNKTYQTSLYANAEHGFAVRTNLTDKKKAFAQESAYFQAVRWFDAWVKDEQ